MDMHIACVTLLIVLTLALLITEKISVDKTAILIMVVLSLSGILTPREAVAGFANPAVVTVAAMFLISRGLIRTGAVGFVTELVLNFSRGSRHIAFVLVLVTVAFASAFINNTPVVVLFIPIVMGLSCDCNFSPSRLLIPLSYISILAGTCTLIGTSTNIIVSDLTAQAGFEPLSMFELSRVGIPVALVGILFLFMASPRLLPGRTPPVCESDATKTRRYIAELIITEGSPLVGEERIVEVADTELGLHVIEVFRDNQIYDPKRSPVTIKAGDTLMVKGSAEALVNALNRHFVEPVHGEEDMAFGRGLKDDLIIELIIPPMSGLLREKLVSTQLFDDSDIRIIALRTRHHHYSYRKIKTVKLKVGDTILVRCPRLKLYKLRASKDVIVIEDIHHAVPRTDKAVAAASIFVAVVISATLGLADIMVCALTGVLAMTVTHCLSLKDAYRSLESEVLLLIVATIALGIAMEKTGATQLYAAAFLGLFSDMSPQMILFGIILLSSICTHVLSNNATAVLLLPIAVSTAQTLGVDPRPFIIGICFGAGACFATPIGYQTHMLVYGPGRYRFSDFLKIGLPLSAIVIVMASLLIPYFWPF